MPPEEIIPEPIDNEIAEYYVASYPYQSQEPGDLSFNAGDMVTVVKKEGDWWTGKSGTNIGIFPSNYVQKIDTVSDSFVSICLGLCCGVTNMFVFRTILLMQLINRYHKHKTAGQITKSVRLTILKQN